MRVWLVSFSLLFVLAEILQWAKGFLLPLPIYLLAGAFLAIASNYDKGIFSSTTSKSANVDKCISQTATLVNPINNSEQKIVTPPSLPSKLQPSQTAKANQPNRSISFTISRSQSS